jgi:hypothetical protein
MCPSLVAERVAQRPFFTQCMPAMSVAMMRPTYCWMIFIGMIACSFDETMGAWAIDVTPSSKVNQSVWVPFIIIPGLVVTLL